MAENTLFRPKAYPARRPTDTSQQHGAVVNPPRMSQLGGLDKTSKGRRNNMTLRKPGGTR